MNLSELEPFFLKREPDGSSTRDCTFEEADGIIFLCPKCFSEALMERCPMCGNRRELVTGGLPGPCICGGRYQVSGVHGVICWRPHVPPDVDPKPGRWEFKGTGIEDLTLVASSSSVPLLGGCNAHFFIEQGKVRML